MQDMNQLHAMGLMQEENVDGMQEAIDSAEKGDEMKAAFNRINDMQNQLDHYKPKKQAVTHVKKCDKQPLAKNKKKRMRRHAL